MRDLVGMVLAHDALDDSPLRREDVLRAQLVEPEAEQMLDVDTAGTGGEGEPHQHALVHAPAAEQTSGLLPPSRTVSNIIERPRRSS